MEINKTAFGLIILILISTVIGVTFLNKPTKIDVEAEDLEVTIYNSNLGVVKEYRTNFLAAGLNDVLYEGVASKIDPTSVRLKSINGNIEVLEQNFQYDLVSRDKILAKYIDKEITAYQIYGDKKELVRGTLLSFSGNQLILKDENGEIQIISVSNLVLPELPEGLITKPTLHWIIDSEEAMNHTLELSYMTSGMTWKADYVVVTNDDDTKLDLNGWVTITNNAGTTFKNTALKLVAGDVHRVRAGGTLERNMLYAEKAMAPSAKQFVEETLFEYHMYDLQRKTTLKNNEQKQISLLSSNDINVEKEYVYDDIRYWWWYGSGWSDTGEKKVNVMLNFENSEENNLGIPLPKGTVRVFKKDSEGKLQFIGEDSIDHTPKDETIRLFIGQAFDIVGQRKQMDFNKLSNWYEYVWEVTLRNHKDEDITVTVLERTGGDWEIVEENYEHTKESNNLIKWKVPVESDGESKLIYTIRYKR
ncbi:MAG: DUF4139 domain-containing protein [Candidatus Altiarchaeales archaeon ex4484_43]|nr:MAG: DUF4139 domain-containing protein [Candidatus Altiarchaeales archaeon ex4484_43]RLI89384.1 MAG: DUF4139 domain-containing protein [Candidatus Altiarchaeales archaeon]